MQKLPDSVPRFSEGLYPIDQTSPQDVFIVGYPKSGNTLLQHIIAHLVYGVNESAGRTLVHLITPDVHGNSHYFRMNDRSFFKSHELPMPKHRNVIYIVRDGREATLSYYHMMRNMGHRVSHQDVYSGKVTRFGGDWHEHVGKWEANPYQANLLWLRFEDLTSDKIGELRKMCEFLELDRTDRELAEVEKLTSLEHMKRVERRSDWKKANESVFKKPACFVRQGKTNSFRDEVDPGVLADFELRSGPVLQRHYPKAG
jgi:hypothetical protein